MAPEDTEHRLGWLGTEAAQLLLERIGGQGGPVKVLYLAPELVVRGSTAPCRQTE